MRRTHGILTRMEIIHNTYSCSGPNHSANDCHSLKRWNNLSLIIIYGGSIRDTCMGWRNATPNIIKFQKNVKQYLKYKKWITLICLAHQTKLNTDIISHIKLFI